LRLTRAVALHGDELKRLEVRSRYLFGSTARDDFDVDLSFDYEAGK